MPKFRTHYDNLKVSRDAPIEVIQAAYRSLARKYHPDRNSSVSDGEAIMKVINASYEVLSDPAKRAKHDQWIAEQLGSGASPQRSGGRSWGAPAGEHRRSSGRRAGQSWTVTDVMMVVAYFGTAIAMLRIPSFRFVGIGMLVAGWLYFQAKWR